MREVGLARRSALRLEPDATRVLARLFVPGQDLLGGSETRTQSTIERILALSDEQVDAALSSIYDRFTAHHADIRSTFSQNFERVADFVPHPLNGPRTQLVGAAFTHELSLEGAAICNPSLVASPDQSGVARDEVRVIMSYRSISEGHRSSISFREGSISADGLLALTPRTPFAEAATTRGALVSKDHMRALLRDHHAGGTTAEAVFASLGSTFTSLELDRAIVRLESQRDTRPNVGATGLKLRDFADCFYDAEFSSRSRLDQRVLCPATPRESHGMEDARFVYLNDGDASHYVATYTAYDGTHVTQQLLETTDFATFTSSPLAGMAARNKGLAIFPRLIDGNYVALSRHDRESNEIAVSADLHCWDETVTIESPRRDWEILQLGNCGSPLELDEGWLVLTHGVGPMRTYSIGALLLDLHDPTKVLARLALPLLMPLHDEQQGYVANVVYSCGSMIHRGALCLAYGVGDQSIRYATVELAALLRFFDES